MAQNILENVKAKVYSDFYQRTLDDIIIYERKSSDLVDLSLLVGVCRNLLFDDHERIYSKIEQVNTNLGIDIHYVRHCSHKYPRCNARQMLEIYEIPTSLIPTIIWGFQSVMLQFFFKIPSGHRFPVRCKTHSEILNANDFRLTRIDLSRGFVLFQDPQIEVELKFKGDWMIHIPFEIVEWEKLLEQVKSSEMALIQPRLQSTDTVNIMTRLVWNKEKMSPKDADERFMKFATQNGFEIGKKMFPVFFLLHSKLEKIKDLVQKHREDVKEFTFNSILLRNTIDLERDISKARELSTEFNEMLY
ncbi:MAG: hypothetical protein ACFFA5_07645 [Promethearchaeota archaeon]